MSVADAGIQLVARNTLMVLLLWFISAAGFCAGCGVGLVHEILMKPTTLPKNYSEIPLMIGLIGVPNILAYVLYAKVWYSSNKWALLGRRKGLWKILLPTAYAIGLAFAASLAF